MPCKMYSGEYNAVVQVHAIYLLKLFEKEIDALALTHRGWNEHISKKIRLPQGQLQIEFPRYPRKECRCSQLAP